MLWPAIKATFLDPGNSSPRYSETQTTCHFYFSLLPEDFGATEEQEAHTVCFSFIYAEVVKTFLFLWAIWCRKSLLSCIYNPLKSSFLFETGSHFVNRVNTAQVWKMGEGGTPAPGASGSGWKPSPPTAPCGLGGGREWGHQMGWQWPFLMERLCRASICGWSLCLWVYASTAEGMLGSLWLLSASSRGSLSTSSVPYSRTT